VLVACKGGALNLGSTASDAGGGTSGPIFIRQVFAPTAPTNGECDYTPDVTQSAESTGIVDVSYPNLANYTPTVLIGNETVAVSTASSPVAETSRVIIQGATTRITDLAGDMSLETMFATMCAGGHGDEAACQTGARMASGTIAAPVNPFSTVETATVEPAQGSDPSYSALSVTIIDGQTMQIMRDYFESALALNASAAFTTSIQLITYTQATGITLGGLAVTSNEFEFPVTFTFGQLVSNLVQVDGAYCVQASTTVPTTAQTCVYGQDAAAVVSAIEGVPSCGALGDAGVLDTDAGEADSGG